MELPKPILEQYLPVDSESHRKIAEEILSARLHRLGLSPGEYHFALIRSYDALRKESTLRMDAVPNALDTPTS